MVQDVFAPIYNFNSDGYNSWGIVNLTRMWPGCQSALRGFWLNMAGVLTVQDEIVTTTNQPVNVIWTMQTFAKSMTPINDNTFLLRSNSGKTMQMTIVEPTNGAVVSFFQTPTGASPQYSNAGYRTLHISVPNQGIKTRIVVTFGTTNVANTVVLPLMKWPNTSAPTAMPSLSPTQAPSSTPSSWPTKASNSTCTYEYLLLLLLL